MYGAIPRLIYNHHQSYLFGIRQNSYITFRYLNRHSKLHALCIDAVCMYQSESADRDHPTRHISPHLFQRLKRTDLLGESAEGIRTQYICFPHRTTASLIPNRLDS